jgi:hypothetical protein
VEPVLAMKASMALLTIAAIGGAAMAFIRFSRNVNPPSWLAMLHGLLAASALTLLLYSYFTVGLPVTACWALLLFLVAAAGGAYLNLGFHVKGLAVPKGIVLAHGATAVGGYVLLVMAVMATR